MAATADREEHQQSTSLERIESSSLRFRRTFLIMPNKAPKTQRDSPAPLFLHELLESWHMVLPDELEGGGKRG